MKYREAPHRNEEPLDPKSTSSPGASSSTSSATVANTAGGITSAAGERGSVYMLLKEEKPPPTGGSEALGRLGLGGAPPTRSSQSGACDIGGDTGDMTRGGAARRPLGLDGPASAEAVPTRKTDIIDV